MTQYLEDDAEYRSEHMEIQEQQPLVPDQKANILAFQELSMI